MTEQFQKFAGDNSAILSELTQNLTPIQTAGPSQFGFSPAEEAALRTGTAEQLSAANSQVANAVRGSMANKGTLPSGSENAIIGALAQEGAVKEAEAQSAITTKGYDIGRQNWEFATEGLMKAPGELESPVTGAGSAATGAASAEEKGAQDITAANQAWMQPVGALLGGVTGGLLKMGTGGAAGGAPTPPAPIGGGTGPNTDWGQ